MSSIDRVREAQRELELLQSALGRVHAGLDAIETVVETTDEVRRGVRGFVKLGVGVAIVGIAAVVILRVRRVRHRQPIAPRPCPE